MHQAAPAAACARVEHLATGCFGMARPRLPNSA